MATRENSLQAVLNQTAKTVAAEPIAPSVPKAAKFYRPSREGRRLIAGHFVPRSGVRALRSTRLPAGRAGTFRLPRWAA